MLNDLGIKSSTVTAFLNDKLTPEQCKELQKIMNLDPKLNRNVFIYHVVNFGPDPNWNQVQFDPNWIESNPKLIHSKIEPSKI